MLLRFVVEPEALKDLAHSGNWDSFLGGLELFWPAHGIFIMPEDFDGILDQSGLDSHRISQWRQFMLAGQKRTFPHNTRGIDWAEKQSWHDLEEVNGQFDLALLQQTTVARFRSSNDTEYCAHDPKNQVLIEITRGDHILYTCRSRRVQDLGSKSVTPEEPPRQVWEERLRDHAKHSTSVLLVDIYAARNWGGLRLFLEKLVTDGRKPGEDLQTVHIYSTYESFSGMGNNTAANVKNSINDGVRQLRKEFRSAVPNLEVQVHLFHTSNFPNDRWMRFDDNVIELGHGLEVLEPGRSQAFSFSLSARDEGRQTQEARLRSICKMHKNDDAISYGTFKLSVCTRPPPNWR